MEIFENRLKILVVLYKKKIYESETILSIIKYKHELRSVDSVVIWNNSPCPLSLNEKRKIEKEMEPVCIGFEGDDGVNHNLPFIYTNMYESSTDSDILVIFDHDSNIHSDYFSELLEATKIYKNINLFLPIIYSGRFIVSPSYMFVVKGLYWKHTHFGILKAKHITAINSGMAIRCRYLKNDFKGYNMNLKFYETDNDFMYKYNQDNVSLYVLKSSINHTLDFYDGKDIDNKLERFVAMRQGRLDRMKTINYLFYVLSFTQYLYFGIKCALKYKEYRFIRLAFVKR